MATSRNTKGFGVLGLGLFSALGVKGLDGCKLRKGHTTPCEFGVPLSLWNATLDDCMMEHRTYYYLDAHWRAVVKALLGERGWLQVKSGFPLRAKGLECKSF